MKEKPHYEVIPIEYLENLAKTGTCPCCHEPFREDMPPELTGKCHMGPTYVAYWDGWLLLECGQCRKPIGKIKVQQ